MARKLFLVASLLAMLVFANASRELLQATATSTVNGKAKKATATLCDTHKGTSVNGIATTTACIATAGDATKTSSIAASTSMSTGSQATGSTTATLITTSADGTTVLSTKTGTQTSVNPVQDPYAAAFGSTAIDINGVRMAWSDVSSTCKGAVATGQCLCNFQAAMLNQMNIVQAVNGCTNTKITQGTATTEANSQNGCSQSLVYTGSNGQQIQISSDVTTQVICQYQSAYAFAQAAHMTVNLPIPTNGLAGK